MRRQMVFALTALAAIFAYAGDPVTDAMQSAYAPYRTALFKTNSKSQADSRQAVEQAQSSWNDLIARYAGKPPTPYDRDPDFVTTLNEVGKVYALAAKEVEQNQLAEAHETLEKVRDLLSALRQRNQVVIYSDHMNAYHAEMEGVLLHGPKLLEESQGLLKLTARVGVLEYLGRRLSTEAPAAYRKNAEFTGLVKAVEKSVADLQAALLAGDTKAAQQAIGRIKVPYSKLFLKFG